MNQAQKEFIQKWFAENESYSLTFNLDGATRRWYVVGESFSEGAAGFSTRTMGLMFPDVDAAKEFCRQAPMNDQSYWARLL